MSSSPLPTSHEPIYQWRWRDCILGFQMLFVAFGAVVLVPLLAGLDPRVALLTAGVGTLVFQLVTGGKIPVFLGSSFAFIAPISLGIKQYGLAATLSGLLGAGMLYLLLSLLVFWRGHQILTRILPTIITGPIIMVIGLSLAPTSVEMASQAGKTYTEFQAIVIAMLALGGAVLTTLLAKGLWRLLPILAGISVGYLSALGLGIVDFTPVVLAPWISWPTFTFPAWNFNAVFFMLPVAIAPAIEHIGDIIAISSVTQRDYLRDPGLHRTLLGDGLATSLAAFVGGPPNTTYSEVTGAVALTGLRNPAVMTWAALTAIGLSFFGKLGALLQTIPAPVMGGILVILFGSIVVVGMQSLISANVDLLEPRTLVIVAVILVFGVGGMSFQAGEFALQGIGLSGLVGVILNLALPLTNQK